MDISIIILLSPQAPAWRVVGQLFLTEFLAITYMTLDFNVLVAVDVAV
jgi:hypothetical protein